MNTESTKRATHHLDEEADELRLRLSAPSLAGLFEEAARALGEVMGAAPAGPDERGAPGEEAETIVLASRDRDALLVHWLNEIICRAETYRRVYTDAWVEQIDDGGLRAVLCGRPSPDGRTLVKAATFHGLHIEEQAGVFSASVLLDV